MKNIINKFLLAGDRLMTEMHLRHPGFTYSACGLSKKTNQEYKNSEKQENVNMPIEIY